MTGTELISQERQRQITEEGWTAKHDDRHTDESISLAAACYAVPYKWRGLRVEGRGFFTICDELWPWRKEWWRPSEDDRIRELVKAGALIAAEIDRLQRLSKKGESQ